MDKQSWIHILVAILLVLGFLVIVKLLSPEFGFRFSIPYLDPFLLAVVKALKSLAGYTARFSPI